MAASNQAADSGNVEDGIKALNTSIGNVKYQDVLTQRGGLVLACPSYFWPDDSYTSGEQRWRRAAGSGVRLMVANPNSGPGTSADANFTRAIDESHNKGTAVLGYVRTDYTRTAAATVKSNIDTWFSLYPKVDGIFFDEADNGQNQYTADAAAYYRDLVSYVKGKNPRYLTVINPGTDFVGTSMYDVADISMTFEHDAATYLAKTSVPDAARVAKTKHWHCVYGATSAQLADIVTKAKALGASLLYVTDDVLPNPYDTLAPAAFLDAVTGRGSLTTSSGSGSTATTSDINAAYTP